MTGNRGCTLELRGHMTRVTCDSVDCDRRDRDDMMKKSRVGGDMSVCSCIDEEGIGGWFASRS